MGLRHNKDTYAQTLQALLVASVRATMLNEKLGEAIRERRLACQPETREIRKFAVSDYELK